MLLASMLHCSVYCNCTELAKRNNLVMMMMMMMMMMMTTVPKCYFFQLFFNRNVLLKHGCSVCREQLWKCCSSYRNIFYMRLGLCSCSVVRIEVENKKEENKKEENKKEENKKEENKEDEGENGAT
jgi:hypothetical protein